jgi:hypothetical protein
MDDDLAGMTRDQLVAEVLRLRAGIRAHRDSTGHDPCWHHPQLWGLLPQPLPRDIAVPACRSFCAAASAIGNRSIAGFPMRLAPKLNSKQRRPARRRLPDRHRAVFNAQFCRMRLLWVTHVT